MRKADARSLLRHMGDVRQLPFGALKPSRSGAGRLTGRFAWGVAPPQSIPEEEGAGEGSATIGSPPATSPELCWQCRICSAFVRFMSDPQTSSRSAPAPGLLAGSRAYACVNFINRRKSADGSAMRRGSSRRAERPQLSRRMKSADTSMLLTRATSRGAMRLSFRLRNGTSRRPVHLPESRLALTSLEPDAEGWS